MRTSLSIIACAAALATGPALAADLPVKAPPAPVYVPYNWTGFYIGANIGGAWSNGSLRDNVTGASLSSNSDGFIGGGQLGYNWQMNNWLLGVEWDIDGTDISKTSAAIPTAVGTLQASAKTNWVSTLAGRVGWTADRWLFYFKGGGAWVDNSVTLNNLTTGASGSRSNTNSGWMVGVGTEWAFAPHWSTKLEYNFVQLSDWSPAITTAAGDSLTAKREINMVKVGVNYKFDWGTHY